MNKRSITLQTFIRFVTQAILKLRGFIFLPVISKNLGAMGYGVYSQVTLTVGLLSPVLLLRLEVASVRYLSGKDSRELACGFFSMLSVILVLTSILTPLLFLFLEPIADFLFAGNSKGILYTKYLIFMLLTNVIFSFAISFYRAKEEITKFSIIQVTTTIIIVGLSSYFVSTGGGIRELLLTFISINALSSVLILGDIIRITGLPKGISFSRNLRYLSYSLPLIANSFLGWVINNSDRYFIAQILGLSQVGTYSASYSLGRLIIFFATAIGFVVFPPLSRLWDNGESEKVKTYLNASLEYIIILSLPAVFGLAYIAPVLLKVLATGEFVLGQAIFWLVGISFFLKAVRSIFLHVWYLEEKTRYLPLLVVFAASINLILNVFLIGRMGILGAAISTVVSYSFLALATIILARRWLEVGIDAKLFSKVLVSAVTMFVFLHIFNLRELPLPLLSVLFGAIIYFVFLALLGGIGRREWELILSLFKKRVSE